MDVTPASVEKKRIALLGIAIESNRFAPVSMESDFAEYGIARGQELYELSMLAPWLDPDGKGFAAVMGDLCDWEPVPILFTMAGAGGACDHDFYCQLRDEIKTGLESAGPLDGVFIFAHGAGITTQLNDLDGDYFSVVRQIVGDSVPIVATLDLHGNVSDKMLTSADVLVAFLTNPHMDIIERTAEAAKLMHEMFEGMQPASAMIRLPLVTPQVCQLTSAGQPYGDLIQYGQTLLDDTIANVSILSGFAFADTNYNGMAIIVTARNDLAAAESAALKLADRAWNDRHQYVPNLIDIDMAIMRIKDHRIQPEQRIVLADVADNPGGGARGNTTGLLRALVEANVGKTYMGIFFDPDLVADAQLAGEDTPINAVFARHESGVGSDTLKVSAVVKKLTNGRFTSRYGMNKGIEADLGPSCLLQVGQIYIVVSSYRRQIFDADTFLHFGLDPEAADVFVVKSRGHFRAGFKHLVEDQCVFQVDAPGLATPNLMHVPWSNLSHPTYPLDQSTQWPPEGIAANQCIIHGSS